MAVELKSSTLSAQLQESVFGRIKQSISIDPAIKILAEKVNRLSHNINRYHSSSTLRELRTLSPELEQLDDEFGQLIGHLELVVNSSKEEHFGVEIAPYQTDKVSKRLLPGLTALLANSKADFLKGDGQRAALVSDIAEKIAALHEKLTPDTTSEQCSSTAVGTENPDSHVLTDYEQSPKFFEFQNLLQRFTKLASKDAKEPTGPLRKRPPSNMTIPSPSPKPDPLPRVGSPSSSSTSSSQFQAALDEFEQDLDPAAEQYEDYDSSVPMPEERAPSPPPKRAPAKSQTMPLLFPPLSRSSPTKAPSKTKISETSLETLIQFKTTLQDIEKKYVKRLARDPTNQKRLKSTYSKSFNTAFQSLDPSLRKMIYQEFLYKHDKNPKVKDDHLWAKNNMGKVENFNTVKKIIKMIVQQNTKPKDFFI